MFVDRVSPAASANKRLVFHSSDPREVERAMAGLRQLTTDRDALIDRLMFPKTIESPSLINDAGTEENS